MALRPMPQPHIPVVDADKRQGTQGWREYWEAADRSLRSLGKPSGAVSLNFEFHGGGLVLGTNTKSWMKIPFDCEILSWTATAVQSGSVSIAVWRDTYANFPPTSDDIISASAPITLSSAAKNTNDTLTGWTKEVPAESYLMLNINSVTTIQDLLVEILVEKT